jgi:hypothetical protein
MLPLCAKATPRELSLQEQETTVGGQYPTLCTDCSTWVAKTCWGCRPLANGGSELCTGVAGNPTFKWDSVAYWRLCSGNKLEYKDPNCAILRAAGAGACNGVALWCY